MTKVSEKILGEIKSKEIRPRCRSYYICREGLWWILAAIFLSSGGFFFAAVLEEIIENRFYSEYGIIEKTFFAYPHLWLFLVGVFSILSFVFYRLTKKSYFLKKRFLLSVFFALALFFGFILYSFEIGKTACDILK